MNTMSPPANGEETKAYTAASLERISTQGISDQLEESDLIYYDYSEKYRWIITGSVIILTVLIGPPFLNWPSFRNLFEANGAYNYACTDNIADSPLTITCPKKINLLENLGGFSASVYFAFTILSGIVFDCVGAKICSMCGMFVNAVGWIVVSMSGPKFNGFQAGMFLVAASTDAMFYGIISVANLFPGYGSTVMALMGSARSVSFAIPIVMESLHKANLSLFAIAIGQACLIFCLFILTAIFIPFRPFPKYPQTVKTLDRTPGPNKIGMKKYVNTLPKASVESLKRSSLNQIQQISTYLRKPTFLAFVAIMTIALLRNNYFTETSKVHLKVAENFYNSVNPLSFLPCPVLGFVADKVSAALASCIIALAGVFGMIFVMIGGPASEYISAIFNWVYLSFIASQCYCYVAYIYPQEVLGKLAGLCLTVAGLVSFSTNSMNNFTKEDPINLDIMDSLVMILGLIAALLAILLYFYVEKPLRYKSNKSKFATMNCGNQEVTESLKHNDEYIKDNNKSMKEILIA